MNAKHQRAAKPGCGGVVLGLLAIIVIAAAITWSLGIFDRLMYTTQVETDIGQLSDELVQDAGTEFSGDYVYQQLDDDARARYLILLDTFQTRTPHTYPETDIDDLARIRDCVLADHPELFYVRGVALNTTTNQASGLVTDVTVEGEYAYSPEEADALQHEIESNSAECLAGLPVGGDDYTKAKYLYEHLIEETEYDHTVAYDWADESRIAASQTIVGVLIEKRAVCAGYARTLQYFLQELGIPCVYVSGYANGGTHAWVAAQLDGEWYFIDPTWGDPQFLDESGLAAEFDRVDYSYLCVTADDISATHSIECPYPVPLCTAVADNYYVREGLYLDSPDVDAFGTLLENALSRGEESVRIRCADWDTYDRLRTLLFEEQEIYRFLPRTSCTYICNDDMLTIEVIA